MKNASFLAFVLLAVIACLLPASAVAQANVYYQSPSSFPFASQVVTPSDGGPLTFEQANVYRLPMDNSQATPHSQPLSFEQANMYRLRPAYSNPYTASQANRTFYAGQSIGTYSWIAPASVEVVASEHPVFSAPNGPQPAVSTYTAACST